VHASFSLAFRFAQTFIDPNAIPFQMSNNYRAEMEKQWEGRKT
jgi:hypothetical protein